MSLAEMFVWCVVLCCFGAVDDSSVRFWSCFLGDRGCWLFEFTDS